MLLPAQELFVALFPIRWNLRAGVRAGFGAMVPGVRGAYAAMEAVAVDNTSCNPVPLSGRRGSIPWLPTIFNAAHKKGPRRPIGKTEALSSPGITCFGAAFVSSKRMALNKSRLHEI